MWKNNFATRPEKANAPNTKPKKDAIDEMEFDLNIPPFNSTAVATMAMQDKEPGKLKAKMTYPPFPFRRPIYVITEGRAHDDAMTYIRDFADLTATIVPWARLLIGPQIAIKTPTGWRRTNSATADTPEHVEDVTVLVRITSILISSAQAYRPAIMSLFRALWQELEAEALLAYGEDYLFAITAALLDGQDPGLQDAHCNECERRKEAFADYAFGYLIQGFGMAADGPMGRTCDVIFEQAADGKLGERLFQYRNALE